VDGLERGIREFELLDYKNSCINTFEDFFPNWDFLWGFLYTYIIYIAGRISEAAMVGAVGAQRPVSPVY
jgi:hypothetical protein